MKTHVVIGNRGHGRQNLWPKSEAPELHTRADAEALAAKLNGKRSRFGLTQVHYHAKHVDDAHEYVNTGQPAWHGLQKLRGRGDVHESSVVTHRSEDGRVHVQWNKGGPYTVHVGDTVTRHADETAALRAARRKTKSEMREITYKKLGEAMNVTVFGIKGKPSHSYDKWGSRGGVEAWKKHVASIHKGARFSDHDGKLAKNTHAHVGDKEVGSYSHYNHSSETLREAVLGGPKYAGRPNPNERERSVGHVTLNNRAAVAAARRYGLKGETKVKNEGGAQVRVTGKSGALAKYVKGYVGGGNARHGVENTWRKEMSDETLREANSPHTAKIKMRYYAGKARELKRDIDTVDGRKARSEVEHGLKQSIVGRPGGEHRRKVEHKLLRLQQAAAAAKSVRERHPSRWPANEETEVNEISMKAAGRYYKAAVADRADSFNKAMSHDDGRIGNSRTEMGWEVGRGEQDTMDLNWKKRSVGMHMAKKRILKNPKNQGFIDRVHAAHESAEQIDEVSKRLLKRYKIASRASEKDNYEKAHAAAVKQEDGRISDKNWRALQDKVDKHEASYFNRRRGQALASKKIGGRAKVSATESLDESKNDHFALKNFLKTKIGNKSHFFYEHPHDKSFKWEGTAWDRREARSKALDAYERHMSKKNEETEISEISKDLALRYISKAANSVRNKAYHAGSQRDRAADEKSWKRRIGIDNAVEKLKGNKGLARVNATEDVEQIDEIGYISPLRPYKKTDLKHSGFTVWNGKLAHSSSNPNMRMNRRVGVDRDVNVNMSDDEIKREMDYHDHKVNKYLRRIKGDKSEAARRMIGAKLGPGKLPENTQIDERHRTPEELKRLSDIGVKHTVVGHGEVDRPFKGGANVKNQSHFWVKFKVNEANVMESSDTKRVVVKFKNTAHWGSEDGDGYPRHLTANLRVGGYHANMKRDGAHVITDNPKAVKYRIASFMKAHQLPHSVHVFDVSESVDEGLSSTAKKNGYRVSSWRHTANMGYGPDVEIGPTMYSPHRHTDDYNSVDVGDKHDFTNPRKAKRVINKKMKAVSQGKKSDTSDDPLGVWHGRNESVEQIDELSKGLLKRYQKRAATAAQRSWDKTSREEDKAMSTDGEKYPDKQRRHEVAAAAAVATWRKRDRGYNTAGLKLSKNSPVRVHATEGVEVNELSRDLLKRYRKRAADSYEDALNRGDERKRLKRNVGQARAKARLSGVSPKTLHNLRNPMFETEED